MKQLEKIRYLVVTSVLLGGCLILNAHASVINNGLVACYPFNGNADDESGNGHDGTVHGAQLTVDRFGNEDSAYRFDGENDYISAAEHPDFTVTDVSVAAWIKTTDRSDGLVHITSCYDTIHNSAAEWYSLFVNTGSRAAGWAVDPGGGVTAPIVYGSTDVTDGEWHFLVGVRDTSSTQLFIYVDGDLEGVLPDISTDELDPIRDFWIGGQRDTSWRYVNGAIDDVSIYNRALSAEEINILYTIPEPASVGLIALMSFGAFFVRRFFAA